MINLEVFKEIPGRVPFLRAESVKNKEIKCGEIWENMCSSRTFWCLLALAVFPLVLWLFNSCSCSVLPSLVALLVLVNSCPHSYFCVTLAVVTSGMTVVVKVMICTVRL